MSNNKSIFNSNIPDSSRDSSSNIISFSNMNGIATDSSGPNSPDFVFKDAILFNYSSSSNSKSSSESLLMLNLSTLVSSFTGYS